MLIRQLLGRSGTAWRLSKWVIVALVLWTALDTLLVRRALARSEMQHEPPRDERIFIASIHWNNEAMLRSHWTPRVVELAKAIGNEKVFVSVKESGSWDKTKEILKDLGHELGQAGIRSQIMLDNTTHEQEVDQTPAESGWVWTTRNKMELRRIPYLARQRNEAMSPLYQMYEQGVKFDKILFLGDVVFSVDDVWKLLATRNGSYGAACALDFKTAPYFYVRKEDHFIIASTRRMTGILTSKQDTFAMRDSEGQEPLTLSWPFFRSRASRRALKANTPVPVTSCWNGMAVFDATPFYEHGLAFRGVADSLAENHIEGSECCLIHSDNQIAEKGVWVNPQVRVAYNKAAYNAINTKGWLSVFDIVRGCWKNRVARWSTTTWFKRQTVRRRVEAWKSQNSSNAEAAGYCLINEMQVLAANGWAHV